MCVREQKKREPERQNKPVKNRVKTSSRVEIIRWRKWLQSSLPSFRSLQLLHYISVTSVWNRLNTYKLLSPSTSPLKESMNLFPAPNPVKQHCLVFGPWLLHRPPSIFWHPSATVISGWAATFYVHIWWFHGVNNLPTRVFKWKKKSCCSRCLQSDAMREGKGVLRWKKSSKSKPLVK